MRSVGAECGRVMATFLVAVLAGCGEPPPTETPASEPPVYPGGLVAPSTLRSPAGMGEAFALEQRVRAEYPDGAEEFRAVFQRRADSLVLVGFGPHGGRGFTLQQTDDGVEFESRMPRELPFPPEFMLHDVQRVFFRGLEGPLPDGEHRATIDGEEIVESWSDGRLLTRSFRRVDDEPPGVLRATYEGGLGGDSPPTIVRFENEWFGYTLILTTLSHHILDAPND